MLSKTIAVQEIDESLLKGQPSARPLATAIDDERSSRVPEGLSRVLPGPGKVGVLKYVPEKCYNGYTLFSPRMGNTAYLVDMEGRIVHTWPAVHCQLAELQSDGSVVADDYDHGLNQANVRREMIWNYSGPYHHDFQFLPNGRLVIVVFIEEPPIPGLFDPGTEPEMLHSDAIWEIDRSGKIYWEFQFGKHLQELHELCGLPLPLPKGVAQSDWAHDNTVEVLPDTPLGRKDERFRAGNLLFSFRQLDIIGVVDREKNAVVWGWGRGELDGQHMPTMLPNGNILIFDNGTLRGYSRVLEINPATEEIVWRYEDPKTFYSPYRAGADRLPNGNTLICSADQSRILEITHSGEIVWDYYPPYSNQNEIGLFSRRMYRATRYNEDQIKPVLEGRPDADWAFVPCALLTDGRVVPQVVVERAGAENELLLDGKMFEDGASASNMPDVPEEKQGLFRHTPDGHMVQAPPASGKGRTTAIYPIVPPPDRSIVLQVEPKAVAANGGKTVRVALKMGDLTLLEETLTAGVPARKRYFNLGRPQHRFTLTFIAESSVEGPPAQVDWGELVVLAER